LTKETPVALSYVHIGILAIERQQFKNC